ncbi:hypothetical protein ACFX5K_00575 [Rickettsiales bacterium LUAb2]
MKRTLTKALFVGLLSGIISVNAFAANKIATEYKMSDHEKMVVELLKSIETGDPKPVAYINPNKYIQHNLGIEDGLAGFGKLLSQLPKGSAKVNTVRVFADGDFVITQTDYNFFGPKVGFDIFRFENGKIVEHWDNLADKATKPNPSGRTQLDGPTQVTDIDKTKANKKLVKNFVDTVLVKHQYNKAADYIDANNYHQHNTMVGDNLSAVQATLVPLLEKKVIVYNKIEKVLGQGNFVLVTSNGLLNGTTTAYYDLFRVANGKIVEHWDILQTIPPKNQWKNNNGKF